MSEEKKKGRERRRHERLDHRMVVRFEHEGEKYRGIIENHSTSGLFLQSPVEFGTGETISLMVGSGDFKLVGRAVWTQKAAPDLDHAMAFGIGVELKDPPDEYLNLVASLLEREQDPRRRPENRFELHHQVKFASGESFLTEYTENLSRGGMYIATEQPMELGQKITAKLEVPGLDEPIEVQGEVCHRLAPGKAGNFGRSPGVGVQFMEIDEATRKKLHQYISRLEVHRKTPERRRLTSSIPDAGSLGEFLAPEILYRLMTEKASGKLLLERGAVTKLIYFRNGAAVFVESNLHSETLAQYLLRNEIITPEEMEESLRVLSQSKLRHGEVLIQEEIIDQHTLMNALIEQQEEKLENTFPWFEGKFHFVKDTNWSSSISIFPLRMHRLIFAGIRRWYPVEVIKAWMGIHEESILTRLEKPDSTHAIPPEMLRFMNQLRSPRTIAQIAASLRISTDEVMMAAFTGILLGWLTQDPWASQPEVSQPLIKKTEKTKEALANLAKRIGKDYERFQDLDFYRLLGVSTKVSPSALTQAFLKLTARYPESDVAMLEDAETQSKAGQILSWARIAYDTLKDPKLREIYARKGAKSKSDLTAKLEIERLLLYAVREIEKGSLQTAASKLKYAVEKFPGEPSLKAYYAWAQFQTNGEKYAKSVSNDLQQVLTLDASDPQVWYFSGVVLAHLKLWKRAERSLSQALKLHPRFVRAQVMLDEVREKRVASEREAKN